MIDGWRLDPAGIRGVLQAMQQPVTDMSTALQALVTASDDATTASGASGVVAAALEQFSTVGGDDIDAITYRVAGGVSGVSGALLAYEAGHDEMMVATQRAGLDAAVTHDLSFFEGEG